MNGSEARVASAVPGPVRAIAASRGMTRKSITAVAVSIKACSRNRTGTRCTGDSPGQGDAEAAAWRVRQFMRRCR